MTQIINDFIDKNGFDGAIRPDHGRMIYLYSPEIFSRRS